MAVEGHYAAWTLTAGEDLENFTPGTGALFKAVALDDGKFANNGREAGGILVYAVGAGKRLTVGTSGYFNEAGSGSYVVGRCLDTAVSSGSVGTGAFNFATIAYMGDSGETA